MALFYLDNDIDRHIKDALEARGHEALRTRDEHLERADDATQLLRAAQTGRILVTHNERDFKLLQRAWRIWPAPVRHAGIIVIPQQRWPPTEAAERIDGFVRGDPLLVDELYWWTVDRGWVRYQ